MQGEAEVKEFRLGHVKSEASNSSLSRVATENSEFLFFSQAVPFWSSVSSLYVKTMQTLEALPHAAEESLFFQTPDPMT